jgi:hypothetical protein
VFRGDNAKAITAFTITSPVTATGTVDEGAKTITVNVPYGTVVTGMIASASHSGASISPDPAAAKSYTSPVTYTVTAADGSTQAYTVTVNVASNTAKAITAFYFTVGTKNYGAGTGTESGSGSISGNSISVTVPYGTNITGLAPTVSHSGASINPTAGTAWGGGSSKTYTVTAEDGTTQNYTVTVNAAPGITVSGITVEGLSALNFSSVPTSPVSASTLITITISGTVTSWYVELSGSGTPIPHQNSSAPISFNAPSVPGFYSVNVFATVGGVLYSGSFGLTVN